MATTCLTRCLSSSYPPVSFSLFARDLYITAAAHYVRELLIFHSCLHFGPGGQRAAAALHLSCCAVGLVMLPKISCNLLLDFCETDAICFDRRRSKLRCCLPWYTEWRIKGRHAKLQRFHRKDIKRLPLSLTFWLAARSRTPKSQGKFCPYRIRSLSAVIACSRAILRRSIGVIGSAYVFALTRHPIRKASRQQLICGLLHW